MVGTVQKVVRKRGFLGWLFLVLFLAFNAFMLLWLFRLIGYWWRVVPTMSDIGRAVASTWDGIGTVIFLSLWFVGDVILGWLAVLTRGSKTIIETAE